MVRAGISNNTALTYNRALLKFEAFREKKALSHVWPSKEQHIILFIANCFESGLAPSTIRTYVAAISFVHKINSWPDYMQSFIVQKMLEGYRRSRPVQDGRSPISIQSLTGIVQKAEHICSSSYETALFQAVFCVAFFGLFRIGELAATFQNGCRPIQFSDVICNDKDKLITLLLRSSKTNQHGPPSPIRIKCIKRALVCPVCQLHKFMARRPSTGGMLFCHANGKELTCYQFAAVLKKCINQLPDHPGHIRSHSFRIGGATYFASLGYSEEQIKSLGRWRSDVYKRYIRR